MRWRQKQKRAALPCLWVLHRWDEGRGRRRKSEQAAREIRKWTVKLIVKSYCEVGAGIYYLDTVGVERLHNNDDLSGFKFGVFASR